MPEFDHPLRPPTQTADAVELVCVQADWTAPDPVSTPIMRAVAMLTDTDPANLTSLATQVDPDALDTVFQPMQAGPERTTGTVSFTFNGCGVTVHADGTILVRADEEPPASRP